MRQQQLPFDTPQTKHIINIPAHYSLIETTCELIVRQHKDSLPDLTNITILLDDASHIKTFRKILLQTAADCGHEAMLGPDIIALNDWLKTFPLNGLQVINNHARELMLVDALREFPHIYGNADPWVLTGSLMELFDELTRWQVNLPDNIDALLEQLANAYGLEKNDHPFLSREASLVHTLWQALRQQLAESYRVDMETARILRLAISLKKIQHGQIFYYCGLMPVTPAEQQWFAELIKKKQLYVVAHDISTDNIFTYDSNVMPENNTRGKSDGDQYQSFLRQVYASQSTPLAARAALFQSEIPQSPAIPVIEFFSASSAEEEAIAIDIKVRQWLLDGKRNIGIVTENRKLARRVRALLERADIYLDDNAGWPLSTTSAATFLERWLETVETDFHYLPFLDCMKSPFINHGSLLEFENSDEKFLELVYLFEQYIVFKESVTSNVERYVKNIEFRKHRSPDEFSQNYNRLSELLRQFKSAASDLTTLLSRHHPAQLYLDALLDSIKTLGVFDRFSTDKAGMQILDEISQMQNAVKINPIEMDWLGFRNWLGLTMERFNFKLGVISSPVKLLTLSNSYYEHFDGVIIAGAEQDYLPKQNANSPFFNDAVRKSLGLPGMEHRHALNFYYYRRLLAAAMNKVNKGDGSNVLDKIRCHTLISRQVKNNDEDVITAPWCELLQSFHRQSYRHSLENTELNRMVQSEYARIRRDNYPLPATVSGFPAPKVRASLIPSAWSASAYQQTVNCPYQFFASRCLKLTPADEIREQLKKSEYGERVHLCLQAFHSDVSNLPGPFNEKIDDANRAQAEKLLDDISIAVFARDIEDNFMHRGWLKHWQTAIPKYIDWQIEQHRDWNIEHCEVNIENAVLSGHVNISGRIDRIDSNNTELDIIDYKTGGIPSREDIESGEAVQLPFYQLLLESSNEVSFKQQAGRAEYLNLNDPKKVKSTVFLEQHTLTDLTRNNKNRLLEIAASLLTGSKTPAWGDPETCRHCDMEGLCRKQTWDDIAE